MRSAVFIGLVACCLAAAASPSVEAGSSTHEKSSSGLSESIPKLINSVKHHLKDESHSSSHSSHHHQSHQAHYPPPAPYPHHSSHSAYPQYPDQYAQLPAAHPSSYPNQKQHLGHHAEKETHHYALGNIPPGAASFDSKSKVLKAAVSAYKKYREHKKRQGHGGHASHEGSSGHGSGSHHYRDE